MTGNSSEPTKHQVSVARGDELASRYAHLLGEDYGTDVASNVVDAIADLLHFARSECGDTAHYQLAQSAVMHVDAELELHALGEPNDVTAGLRAADV